VPLHHPKEKKKKKKTKIPIKSENKIKEKENKNYSCPKRPITYMSWNEVGFPCSWVEMGSWI